jgi:hypothetical protein
MIHSIVLIIILITIKSFSCNLNNIPKINNSTHFVNFSPSDLTKIKQFVNHLKQNNGDWSKNGLQRIVRLNSECSRNYLSLRNFKVKADVPVDEAFKDPFSN